MARASRKLGTATKKDKKMIECISNVKKIEHTDSDVFRVLSDLSHLERMKNNIAHEKIEEFSCTKDSCSFKVSPIGDVRFVVVERKPNSLVKLKSEELPFDVFCWIQLVNKGETDTRMRITVRAEAPVFMKPMLNKPLQEAIDKIANLLETLPYDTF